ncbi:hypothetical protein KBI23_18490 [bacterium]|nr:hypothetical protein [bacterium]MBP9811167.1 hypothetical protein [bacterium]
MTDRRETLDTPVNKLEPAAQGEKDGGNEDALHTELHALSPIGSNPSDNLAKGPSRPLDTPPSVPPLTIDGLEQKKAPGLSADATPEAKTDGKPDAPNDEPTEGKDSSESPLDSITLEKKTIGQDSIRGQNRYLDTEATNLTSVNMEAEGKAGDGKADPATETTSPEEVPPRGPVPGDLTRIVGEEREQEFRQAFELMDRFDQAINEEVLKPGITKFTEMLDQAERDMPKEKLDALEAERKKYGLELDAFNEANKEPPPNSPATLSTLLYHAPPERGSEMKEFDRTVQDITTAVGKEMAANMRSVGEKFNHEGKEFTTADELVQEYHERKDELTPRWTPLPESIEV